MLNRIVTELLEHFKREELVIESLLNFKTLKIIVSTVDYWPPEALLVNFLFYRIDSLFSSIN